MIWEKQPGHEVQYFIIFFMNLPKSISFIIGRQFEPKHDVAHLQYQFYPFAD